MFVKQLLIASAAVGALAASDPCSVTTTTVASQAEATKLASCKTIKGSVVLGTEAGSNIDLSGPKEITGDFSVLNNGILENLVSSTLTTVGGAFTMNNVTKLSTLNMAKLTSVGSLRWQSVTNLNAVTLGPLTKADEVIVSDTFLDNLDSINLKTVRLLDINNNRRLKKFAPQLNSLSENFNIQANGIGLDISLPNLAWIANMTIANVTTFSVPSLQVVNGSARFDSNYFESFSAPNLTHTESGDISFVGNAALTNMTFPKLTSIGGGLLIANNTGLDKVTFFNKLTDVGGAVKLRGNFTEVDFPELNVVKGAFDVSSTGDITSSCENLMKAAPSEQGGDGRIAGTFTCTSNNDKANEDTDGTTSDSGDVDTGSGKNNDKNSAAGLNFNAALLGLVAVAAFASAL